MKTKLNHTISINLATEKADPGSVKTSATAKLKKFKSKSK